MMWAPQPSFMYDDDDGLYPNVPENDNRDAQIALALECFTEKYEPATEETITDYFTSAEITGIVNNHTGVDAKINEIHGLLGHMSYKYKLEDGEFKWLVRKISPPK